MQKILQTLAICFLILSCNNQSQKKEPPSSPNLTPSKIDEGSNIGRTNYAVIWQWTTTKPDLVNHHLPTISEELTKLWEKDIIENAYFDAEAKSDKLGQFANVAFFLKAYSLSEARSILNELTVVKQGISAYTLHPVGLLWLDRNTEAINKKRKAKSFAAVWKTEASKPKDAILRLQSEQVTKLWNEGTIENVYFDIEGTQKANLKTDFVFFVNANTKEEAEIICKELPFFQENLATYKLFEAGVFWMGKYAEN